MDLYEFAEAIEIESDRLVVLEYNHKLPTDQSGIIELSLKKGCRYVADQLLKTETQIRNVCEYLDIPISDEQHREELLSRIGPSHILFVQAIGFDIVKRYAQQLAGSRQALSTEPVLHCAKMVERLVRDYYSILLGNILYSRLSDRDKKDVDNFKLPETIGKLTGKLEEYNNQIKPGGTDHSYKDRDLIEQANGQISIFPDSAFGILRELAKNRNKLAHDVQHSKREEKIIFEAIVTKTIEFVENVAAYIPRTIIPVHYGISSSGFQYVAYLSEDDLNTQGSVKNDSVRLSEKKDEILPEKCPRYYLLERGKPDNFRPNEPAYLLHKDGYKGEQLMADPKIYYQDSLPTSSKAKGGQKSDE